MGQNPLMLRTGFHDWAELDPGVVVAIRLALPPDDPDAVRLALPVPPADE
jgi:hypothetical protein